MIHINPPKSNGFQESLDLLIPNMRALLEIIQTLFKFANKILSLFKSFWLFHVNLFINISCQECRNDIHLLDFPVQYSCYCEEHSQGDELRNWGVCFEIIDVVGLREIFSD